MYIIFYLSYIFDVFYIMLSINLLRLVIYLMYFYYVIYIFNELFYFSDIFDVLHADYSTQHHGVYVGSAVILPAIRLRASSTVAGDHQL